MPMTYNTRNPAVKRLLKEAQELSAPTELYYAQPLEDNLFEWHFTIRGPEDTDFQGGIYHGRILLPSEYPMKPPNIVMLTPNGRFETNRKICLSISGYHPESWRPSWSIRTALLAIIGFMPTHGIGAIGSLDLPGEERKLLAIRSQHYVCSSCGPIRDLLNPLTTASVSMTKEASEAASQISMMSEDSSSPKRTNPLVTSSVVTEKSLAVDDVEISATSNLQQSTSTWFNSDTNMFSPSYYSNTIMSTDTCVSNFLHGSNITAVPFSNASTQCVAADTSVSFPNLNSQIAYWLCFPVYYQPHVLPMTLTGTSCSSTNAIMHPQCLSGGCSTSEPQPLSFSDWLKQVREKYDANNTAETVSTTDARIKSTVFSSTTTLPASSVCTIHHDKNSYLTPTINTTIYTAQPTPDMVTHLDNSSSAPYIDGSVKSSIENDRTAIINEENVVTSSLPNKITNPQKELDSHTAATEVPYVELDHQAANKYGFIQCGSVGSENMGEGYRVGSTSGQPNDDYKESVGQERCQNFEPNLILKADRDPNGNAYVSDTFCGTFTVDGLDANRVKNSGTEFAGKSQTNKLDHSEPLDHIPQTPQICSLTSESSDKIDGSSTMQTTEIRSRYTTDKSRSLTPSSLPLTQSVSAALIRTSPVTNSYRAANVCAVGVAVALFVVVLRRLALMFHGM